MRSWIAVRAELARAVKADPSGDHTELRRELRAARGEEFIHKLVQGAPPLTAQQRATLRAALHDPMDDLPSAA